MNEGAIPESISRRISSLRWFACLTPALIHAAQVFQFFVNNIPKLQTRLVPLLDDPYRWAEAIIYGWLAVGVVPLFFLFSGYLHFARPRPYLEALQQRVPRLLVPMTLWTMIFCLIALALIPYAGLNKGYDFLFSTDPKRWLICLIGDYTHPFEAGLCCPTVYQFWYLRDLIVLIVISPLVEWGLRRAPILSFALVCASAFGNWRPLIIGTTSLMFYTLGAFCGIRKIDFFAIADKYCPWPLLTLALIVQIVIMRHIGNSLTLNPMVACFISTFFFLKVSTKFVASKRRYLFLHRLDRQSFFLYCCHGGTVCPALLMLTSFILPYNRPWMVTIGIFLIFALNVVLCTGIGLALEHWSPRLFSLLTGNRK